MAERPTHDDSERGSYTQRVMARRSVAGSRRWSPRSAAIAPIILLALGSAAVSCTGARPVRPADGVRAAAPDPGVAPWDLPPQAFPTQRLFRLQVDRSKESGTLRLVLRLAGPERFRLAISDRLGRALYTVDAAADGGWLIDHRERRACRLEPGVALGGGVLESFDVAVLPRVLLGRVPARPAGQPSGLGGDALSFRDLDGARWSVRRRGDEVISWISWAGGEPAVWWRRIGDEALLSDRRRGVQMRWRQVAREALPEPLPPAAPPSGYAEGPCDGPAPAASVPGPGADGTRVEEFDSHGPGL